MTSLLIFGHGYTGRAVAQHATDINVLATSRSVVSATVSATGSAAGDIALHRSGSPGRTGTPAQASSVTLVPFAAAEPAIAAATHILVTAPPDAGGDPVLNRYADAIPTAPMLRWIGYLSSTVVYGDRGGDWVDEASPASPSQPRGQRRLETEQAWSRFASRYAVDLFRLAGIYGPGRSAFDDLRAGTARRISKPDHLFGRIHRDDIAQAVTAAMRQDLCRRVCAC